MKKVLVGFCIALSCAASQAQEAGVEVSSAPQPAPQLEQPAWPIWLAFNSTKDIDVIGMRITFPYGDCEGVTGFDLGVFGRCRYFEGFQLNILRNDAKDALAGFQVGIYNSCGRADILGVQIGLWNEAHVIKGCQLGLINITDAGSGLQIGIVNRAESFYGFQVGAVNVIRENEFAFLPLVNIGFDLWTDPKF